MSTASKRPNILLLMTDQQRFDTIRAGGALHMETPNLDRLAGEGCLFEHAYTPHPVCVPARHSTLTGCTSRVHGFHTNNSAPCIFDDGTPTLPRVLSEAGYFTAAVGKMHFKPVREHHGFAEMHLMEEIPEFRRDDAYASWLKEKGYEDLRAFHGVRPYLYHEPQEPLVPEELHGSAFVAQRTNEILEDLDAGRPFFIWSSWIHPHPPLQVPERWRAIYRDKDLPEPVPISREEPYFDGRSAWWGDEDSPETKRAFMESYYGAISMVDHYIGKVLACLERKGCLDNTLIIFTSDHGEMLYDKGFMQKTYPYESSARVPMIMRLPECFEAGSRRRDFVDLMDIFPTALDVAGIDRYAKESRRRHPIHGQSLFEGKVGNKDRSLQYLSCMNNGNRWVAIRDVRYKYIYFENGGLEAFYDLKEDPGEVVNLLKCGRFPEERFNYLRGKAVEYERERGIEGLVEDGDFVPAKACPWKDPVGGVRFPTWTNLQFPPLREKKGSEERRLFMRDFNASLRGEDWKAIAPDQAYIDLFEKALEKHGETSCELE